MSDDVLKQLEDLAPGLPAEIERLEGQRAKIDNDIKRLRRLSAVLTDEPAQPRTRKRADGRKSHTRVGPERLLRIAEAMLVYGDEPFTVREITDAASVPQNVGHFATQALRELEFIGKAGQRRREDGRGQPIQLWKVLDAHRIDELRADVRGPANGVVA